MNEMNLRYSGSFYSRRQILYTVQILQYNYSGAVEEIAFCDVPLDIEWPSVDKFEPVQSSRATLQLYSDTDRRFVDLYNVRAGSVRMDVLRNGELYWSGTLDPELYEEPFSYKENYGVTLTFSDLAILDRLTWSKSDFVTVREILDEIIEQSGIKINNDKEVEWLVEYISTKAVADGQVLPDNLLTGVSVVADNFYDEDGEPMTLREVLDETLRPFALRLVQKNGKIVVYDLNCIHTELSPATVNWQGNDAVLGVDKIFNNVKLTFSPYEKTTLLSGVVDPDSVTEEKKFRTWLHSAASDAEVGFDTILSKEGKGLKIGNEASFYRINPVYSGSTEAGIAWTVRAGMAAGNPTKHQLNIPTSNFGSMLFHVPSEAFIAKGSNPKFRLKLTMQLLFDPRYNPFEPASKVNDAGNWDEQKDWANFAYVPFILSLRNKSGTLYHWENKQIKDSRSFDRKGLCGWVEGPAKWDDAWMCWYEGNRKNESGLGGWQGNKQIIGYYRGDHLPTLFNRMDKGEYIDLPPIGGWLELQVGTGVEAFDYYKDDDWVMKTKLYEQCCWILYKEPKLELVNEYGKGIETRDVEHSAWINQNAKEELKIDTILGTLKNPSSTALGQLFLTSGKSVINEFSRAGITDQIERLLIGSVYSNYAARHHTLAGTVDLLPAFGTYTDASLPGNYLLLGEIQHLREDESEIIMAQFGADKYEGMKFV